MNGDGGDGVDGGGGPPQQVPAEIGGGNQTTPTELPSIPNETRTGDAQVPETLEPANRPSLEYAPRRVASIDDIQVHDGVKSPDHPDAPLLTTEEAQRIAAELATRAGLIQEPGNYAVDYKMAEQAVARAKGTTREAGGPVDVILPESGVPGEQSRGLAGLEVKVAKELPPETGDKRFAIGYAEYSPRKIEGLPPEWVEDWNQHIPRDEKGAPKPDESRPLTPEENQARAREIAERLHKTVKATEAEKLQRKGVDPERVTVVAIPYDPKTQDAQIFQLNRGDVFPEPGRLDWHLEDEGLVGVDRATDETVINWNRNGGQIRAYISPQDAIRYSDIFPLKLPEGYGQPIEDWVAQIYPNIPSPTNSRQK